VAITPSSPPEQKNRAAERCYIAARARKRAETKMQSPARRQNVGWFSSLEVRENQKLIHWLGPESRPQLVEKDNQLPGQNINFLSSFLVAANSATDLASYYYY